MAEVAINVIGRDLLSAPFKLMQSSVSAVSSELGKLGQSAASRSLDTLTSSVSRLAGEMQSMTSRAISPMTIAMGNLYGDVMRNGIDAILNLKRSVESFSFIRLNMDMEMTRSSFTTLTGSADKANETLKILRQYANFTPFEFTQLTAATKKMLAFGFSVEEITKSYGDVGTGLLDVIGNAASALGAGQEGIERITRALGQMRGLARVSAEDMNQLTDVGVQGYQILAEQLGMTVAQVRDAMKKGAIDAETGISALLKGMMAQYGGGMESFSKTAEGMSSTLNDYIADIKRSFGELAYKQYAELLREVTKLVGSPAFAKFAQMLGVQFGGAVERLNQGVLIPTVRRMYEFVNAVGESDAKMQSLFDGMMGRLRPVTEAFRALMLILKNTATIIGQFVTAFFKLGDVKTITKTLTTDFAYFVQALFDFADRIKVSDATIQRFAQAVMAFIRPVIDIFRNAIPVFKVAGDIIGGFLSEILQTGAIEKVFYAVVAGLRMFSQVLVDLVPRLIDVRDAVPFLFDSFMKFAVPFIGQVKNVGMQLFDFGKQVVAFVSAVANMQLVKDIISGLIWVWGKFGEVLNKVLPAVNSTAGALPTLVQRVDALYISIKNFISNIIAGGWEGAIARIKDFFSGLGATIAEQFGENGFLSPSNLANLVSGGRDRLYTFILQTIRGGIDKIRENMPEIVAYFSAFLGTLMDNLSGLLATAWGWISQDSTGLISSIGALLRTAGEEISKRMPDIGNLFSNLPSMISDAWANNSPAIMNGINVLWTFIKDQLGKVWNWISTDGMVLLDQALQVLFALLDSAIKGLLGMFSGDTFNNLFAEIESSLVTALGAVGDLLGRMLYVAVTEYLPKLSEAIYSYVPALGAVLLKIGIQLSNAVTNMLYSLVSGIIQGILRMMGLDEYADKVKKFFDNLIGQNREMVAKIATMLDAFTNFWLRIDILGTFSNFVNFVKDFIANGLPVLLQSLGAIPGLLVTMVSAKLNEALTGLVNTIESTINNIVSSLSLGSGVKNMFGNLFQGLRDNINGVTSTTAEAASAIHDWYSTLTSADSEWLQKARGILQFDSATQKTSTTTDKLANSVDKTSQALSTSNYEIYAQKLSTVSAATATLANDTSFLTELMKSMGGETASAMRNINTTIASTDFAKSTATVTETMAQLGANSAKQFVTQFTGVITGTGRVAMIDSIRVAFDSMVAQLNSGIVYSKFYTVGQTIAQGIMAGLNANLTGVIQIIYSRLGIAGIVQNISTLQTQVTTLQQQVAALTPDGGGGGGGGGGAKNISTTVNQKTVNMEVTINQTTPTDTVNNVRYAQALAASKIY